jgi:tetratricopeptide (TPR) repeat protein
MDQKDAMDRTGEENRKLAGAIRAITLLSLAAVLALLLIFEIIQLRGGAWAGAATLSLALLIGGYVVGLLFAVPKTPSEGLTATQQTGTSTAVSSNGDAVRGERTTALQRRILLVNTSFEQISDWLTKIIVGVGLVQFKPILDFVETRIGWLATDLSSTTFSVAEAQPVATAIVIAFPALGVLSGFFSVRLYIAWAIYVADADATRPLYETFTQTQKELVAAVAPSPGTTAVKRGFDPPPSGTGGPTGENLPKAAAKAIDQILDVPLSDLSAANDLVTWGRASAARGRFSEARDAFAKAIEATNGNPEVVLEYVETLYRLPPIDHGAMIKALERALSQLGSTTDLNVRHGVIESLINAYLYTPPPKGFANALALGEKYIADDGSRRYTAYVYLSAAHGQRYSYYKKQGDSHAGAELAEIVRLVRKAIEIGGPKARSWIARLTTPEGGDDDLVDAVKDNAELSKLLGLETP